MKMDENYILVRIGRLIIGYLHNQLTEAEKDALDDWICISPDHEEIFAHLTEGLDDAVFDPNHLLIETEEATELWIIAGLIIRHQQKMIGEVEEKSLHEWVNACDLHLLDFVSGFHIIR